MSWVKKRLPLCVIIGCIFFVVILWNFLLAHSVSNTGSTSLTYEGETVTAYVSVPNRFQIEGKNFYLGNAKNAQGNNVLLLNELNGQVVSEVASLELPGLWMYSCFYDTNESTFYCMTGVESERVVSDDCLENDYILYAWNFRKNETKYVMTISSVNIPSLLDIQNNSLFVTWENQDGSQFGAYDLDNQEIQQNQTAYQYSSGCTPSSDTWVVPYYDTDSHEKTGVALVDKNGEMLDHITCKGYYADEFCVVDNVIYVLLRNKSRPLSRLLVIELEGDHFGWHKAWTLPAIAQTKYTLYGDLAWNEQKECLEILFSGPFDWDIKNGALGCAGFRVIDKKLSMYEQLAYYDTHNFFWGNAHAFSNDGIFGFIGSDCVIRWYTVTGESPL